jgi:8-oxo-dGTP pyrophosphatase MutT (NUDIX family)
LNTVDETQVAKLIRRYGPIEREHHDLAFSAKSMDWWRGVRAKGRQGEVILALERPGGRVLLHTKGFYPAGAYRLISGGVKPREAIEKAVRREGYEELGLDVRIERFLGVITYTFHHAGEAIPFTSYVFVVASDGDGQPHVTDPDERITGYREIPWADLPAVADALAALADTPKAPDEDWGDWGRFRAIGHRFVGRLVTG